MSLLHILLQTLVLAWATLPVDAIFLDPDDPQSIRDAAAIVAYGLQAIYNGNQTNGVLGKFPFPPYYWWESGAAWGGMMNYWHYTGDGSYNNVTYNALISQIGPANDFVMPTETYDEGNDDQGFWVLAAMSAAEFGFQQPPSPYPCWQELCVNAFNDYVSRWNTSTCGGGLQWQFYPSNPGFYYKNAISNGVFFQLSARLARMTGNQTYVTWAEEIWEWTRQVGLIDDLGNVFDGTDDTINCTRLNHKQWTYNTGIFLYGCAVMQNYTNSSAVWVDRTDSILNGTATFFTPYDNATNIMFEPECEEASLCNNDQFSMKAYLARWLTGTSLLAPNTAGQVGSLLRASALGAAAACTGGPYGNNCGTKWYINGFDNVTGLGQQLSALEVICGLLVNQTAQPSHQSSVSIRQQPSTVTPIPPVVSNPTQSARPLYDVKNGGNELLPRLTGLLVISLMASFRSAT